MSTTKESWASSMAKFMVSNAKMGAKGECWLNLGFENKLPAQESWARMLILWRATQR